MSIGRSADRFSGLADEIRHHVLNFLPLKEAVISSVLSTEWKNLWSYLPSLCFDDREIKQSLEDVVCRILTRHRGPLKEFSLSLSRDSIQNDKYYRRGLSSSRKWLPYDDDDGFGWFLQNQSLLVIDEILNLLPRRTITSLTIGYFDNRKCTLPMRMSMVSPFVRLETLRLSHCLLDSPPGLFDKLTVLELRHVKFFSNSAAPWRFVCPLLTTLTLEGCTWIPFWSIELPVIVIEEAPKLSCFHLEGDFGSLQFSSCTPLLKEVFIRKRSLNWTVESDLLKVNGGLAAVESLSVGRFFYEYLAADKYVECNHKPWKKLKLLRLDDVRLRAKGHARTVLRMINSSLNLQQLMIQMDDNYDAVETKKWQDDEALETMKSGGVDDGAGSGFQLLKRIEVKGVRGSDDELSLISWLLNSSPTLEQMEIRGSNKYISSDQYSQIAKLVNGFRRASSKSQINIKLDYS